MYDLEPENIEQSLTAVQAEAVQAGDAR
jgi:hypothetical protein